MAACCSSPQWFSRDRMTGYGDSCGREGQQLSHSPLPHQDPCYARPPTPFRPGRQRQGSGEPTLGETECVDVGHTGVSVHVEGQRSDLGHRGRGGVSGELRVAAGMFFFYKCSLSVNDTDHVV